MALKAKRMLAVTHSLWGSYGEICDVKDALSDLKEQLCDAKDTLVEAKEVIDENREPSDLERLIDALNNDVLP